MKYVGLDQQIRQNNLKSILLLIGFPAVILLGVFAFYWFMYSPTGTSIADYGPSAQPGDPDYYDVCAGLTQDECHQTDTEQMFQAFSYNWLMEGHQNTDHNDFQFGCTYFAFFSISTMKAKSVNANAKNNLLLPLLPHQFHGYTGPVYGRRSERGLECLFDQ